MKNKNDITIYSILIILFITNLNSELKIIYQKKLALIEEIQITTIAQKTMDYLITAPSNLYIEPTINFSEILEYMEESTKFKKTILMKYKVTWYTILVDYRDSVTPNSKTGFKFVEVHIDKIRTPLISQPPTLNFVLAHMKYKKKPPLSFKLELFKKDSEEANKLIKQKKYTNQYPVEPLEKGVIAKILTNNDFFQKGRKFELKSQPEVDNIDRIIMEFEELNNKFKQ